MDFTELTASENLKNIFSIVIAIFIYLQNAKCMTTICLKNPGEYVVGTKCSSFLGEEDFRKCIAIAKKSAEDISQFYKESVQKRYLKAS